MTNALKPNWTPLEKRLGAGNIRIAEWMWMHSTNGLEHYKHSLTRKYLVLDSEGNAYQPVSFVAAYQAATEAR